MEILYSLFIYIAHFIYSMLRMMDEITSEDKTGLKISIRSQYVRQDINVSNVLTTTSKTKQKIQKWHKK